MYYQSYTNERLGFPVYLWTAVKAAAVVLICRLTYLCRYLLCMKK